MSSAASGRNGGELLIAALRSYGCDRVFGVPGESYLPLLDAMYAGEDGVPGIEFIVCRHEANAVNMANADAKLTGRPGVCAVSRGPGAMHAAIGVHTAQQDSTPLILLVGQVPSDQRGLGAFQEMHYGAVFGSVAKYVAEITDPAEIPAVVAQAYLAAMSGRRGPVVLALPEDMLEMRSEVADLPPAVVPPNEPDAALMTQLDALLANAQRPLLILGGDGWDAAACAAITGFAERQQLPVVAGFRCQDLVSTRHAHYAGDLGFAASPRLVQRVHDADLLLVVGERLGDITTQGYTLLARPKPQQTFVHVYPEATEIGHVYVPDLGIVSDMRAFAAAAASRTANVPAQRAAWCAAARVDFLAFQEIPARRGGAEFVDMAQAMGLLRERLPHDTIVTNGAGNYAGWVNRFYSYDGFRTQLAPVSGAMGYGLPAAIAAKMRHPERTVVAFAGDGCFTMAMADLATAVQFGVNILVIIVNNNLYGSIRMHQERQFPHRRVGVDLRNPDFAALAVSFGAFGATVSDIADLDAALTAARAAGRPAVIDVRTDPRLISPGLTLP